MAKTLSFVVTLLLAAVVRAGHAEQDPPQRFRGRVVLITVDVAAVDSRGKPVEDLRPGDFTVQVDGKRRSVVSADDVPTRGTAWIEETTGRILQTELETGRGRSAPAMVTKFGVDDRLQVTVPVEMRTRNPEGIAMTETSAALA